MVRFLLLLAVVSSVQLAEAQSTVPLDAFLEHRVVEELATEGTVLARLGLALDVELVGDGLLVSLGDPATGRVLASTTMADVPADREAAVASVTQVVANLAAGLSTASASDARRESDTRETQQRYREEALSFGEQDRVVARRGRSTLIERKWVLFRGDSTTGLDGADLYTALGRPDLARAYTRRRRIGIGAGIAGSVLGLTGGVLLLATLRETDAHESSPYRTWGLVTGGLGLAGLAVAVYFNHHRWHPISEDEVHVLVQAHNANLRRKLGVTRPRDVQVQPYAGSSGGGLAVVGRF